MDSIVTVTTASETFDLTTLERVKRELGITTGTDDAALIDHIHAESVRVADWCNRVFAEQTYSEAFRLPCSADCLILSHRPVSSITSVVEDGVTLEADEYEVNPETGLLYRLDGDDELDVWPAVKITAVYVAGYALLTDLPRPIEEATIKLVTARHYAKSRDPFIRQIAVQGVDTVSYGFGGTDSPDGLPPEVAAMLSPYRDPVVG